MDIAFGRDIVIVVAQVAMRLTGWGGGEGEAESYPRLKIRGWGDGTEEKGDNGAESD